MVLVMATQPIYETTGFPEQIEQGRKIFISYSHYDAADFADHVHQTFSSRYSVFLDKSSIRGGEKWRKMISDHIAECDLFILIVTWNSLKSVEVTKELLLAIENKKFIIPCKYRSIRWEDIKWPEIERTNLSGLQYVEFKTSSELVRELEAIIEAEVPNEKISETKVVEISPPPDYSEDSNISNNHPTIFGYDPAKSIPSQEVEFRQSKGESIDQYNDSNLEKTETVTPENKSAALMNTAIEYFNNKNYGDALKYFEIILDKNPAEAQVLEATYYKGLIFQSLSRYSEALECYNRVTENDPENEDVLINRISCLKALDRTKEAKKYEKELKKIEESGDKGKTETFRNQSVDLKLLLRRIQEHLAGFEISTSEDILLKGTRYFIQAKHGGAIRSVIGARRSVGITVTGTSDNFDVSMRTGEWKKNFLPVAAMAPLYFTPAVVVAGPAAAGGLFMGWRFKRNLWNYIKHQIKDLHNSATNPIKIMPR